MSTINIEISEGKLPKKYLPMFVQVAANMAVHKALSILIEDGKLDESVLDEFEIKAFYTKDKE
jgi:hypothetical protein